MMFHSTTLRRVRLLVASIVAIASMGFMSATPVAAAVDGISTAAGYTSTSIASPTASSAYGFRGGAFSPNGSTFYLTRGTDEKILSIPSSGGSATAIAQGGSSVVGLGLSPDGTVIYSALRAGGVLKHNADGSGSSSTFGSGFVPNDIAVSPAGKVYVGANSGAIIRWNADGTGQTTLATPTDPTTSIVSIAISPDGTKLAWSQASRIGVMNIDGTGITTIATGIASAHLAFGPDGLLYAGSSSGVFSQSVIRMTIAGADQTTIATGFGSVAAITVNPSGRSVYVQDLTRSDIVVLLSPPVSVTARNHVASGFRGLGVGASTSPTVMYSDDFVNNVAASADGSTVYAATDFGLVARMTASGYDQAYVSTADNGWLTDMVLSADGNTVYAAAPQIGWIVKFSATTPGGRTNNVADVNSYAVESLAISPDGTKLYLAGSDRILSLNTDGTGLTTLATIPNSGSSVKSIAISPDGSTLYAGGTGSVWSIGVVSGTVTKLSYTPSNIAKVSVLPDGRLLVLDIGSGTTQNLYVLDANLSNPAKIADGTTGSSSLGSVFTDARGNIFLASADATTAGVSGFIELQSTVPAAPTSVTATGSGSTGGPITVSWTAPTDTGGSALTGFTVTASTGDATCTAGPSATSCTIGVADGLSFGASVSYRVTATNADGTSVPSAWSSPLVEYNNPQAPPVYSAALHNTRQVYMTWGSPGGGSPGSTGYVLRDPITGAYDVTWYTSCWCPAVFGPFPAGHSYTFDFYATTAYGNSAAAQVGPFNFAGAPTAPTEATAVPGDRSATVSWTPYPGVYPAISSYAVTASPGGATCTYTVVEGGTNSCVVSGLETGSTYSFSIVPTSSFSDGAAATTDAVEIEQTVPTAPTNVTGIAHDGYVDVYWETPEFDGGLAITGYWAQAYTSAGVLIDGAICSTTGNACGIAGLTNGDDYKFSVRATNDLGYSEYAALSSTYTPIPNVVPDAPTEVTAIAATDTSVIPSRATAVVSWTAPEFDGGLPITGYWAQAYTASGSLIAGAICSTTGLSCTIPSLAQATAYQFSVRATNDVGYSEYATLSSSVTTPGFTNPASALILQGADATVSLVTTGLAVGAQILKRSGSLPAGMSFADNGDGSARISGTPTTTGKFTIVFTGGDAPNQITQRVTIYVGEAPSISITGSTVTRGRNAKIRITTSAGGYRSALQVTGLPSWATFTDKGNGTGEIVGLPDVAGATSIRVTALGYPLAVASLDTTIVVNSAPSFTSAASTTMTRGILSSFVIATNGGHPTSSVLSIVSGTVPRGLIFVDNGDGTATISGTPTLLGRRTIKVRATAGSLYSQQSLLIIVN